MRKRVSSKANLMWAGWRRSMANDLLKEGPKNIKYGIGFLEPTDVLWTRPWLASLFLFSLVIGLEGKKAGERVYP